MHLYSEGSLSLFCINTYTQKNNKEKLVELNNLGIVPQPCFISAGKNKHKFR